MGVFKARSMKKAIRKVQLGMNKQDVLSMLGNPNSQKMQDGKEVYTWWSQEWKGALRGGSIERRLIVEFQEDKVVGFDGVNMDAIVG